MAKRKTNEQRMREHLEFTVRNQLQELIDYHSLREFIGSGLQDEELEDAMYAYVGDVLLPIIHAWVLGNTGRSQVEIDELLAVQR